jgi:Uma2 family endonuclease
MFVAPFDVKLPISKGLKDATVVQPDLLVVCDESKLDKRGCNGSPDLVVEILSKSNQ